jgi:hypothetical protein
MTLQARRLVTAKKYREDCGRRSWRKRSIMRQGREVRSALQRVELSRVGESSFMPQR